MAGKLVPQAKGIAAAVGLIIVLSLIIPPVYDAVWSADGAIAGLRNKIRGAT